MDLVTITNPRSPLSEAFRTLRTNLSFYSLESPLRSLVVTSPVMGEGKSSTVANLAVTMAQSGRKTALVDCDLRRPSLHSLFDLKAEPGFTDAILHNGEPALQETAVPNLWLLAAGTKPPNPANGTWGASPIRRSSRDSTSTFHTGLAPAPQAVTSLPGSSSISTLTPTCPTNILKTAWPPRRSPLWRRTIRPINHSSCRCRGTPCTHRKTR